MIWTLFNVSHHFRGKVHRLILHKRWFGAFSVCLSSVMTVFFVFKESKSLVTFIVVREGEWAPWTSLHFKRWALPKICHLEIGKLQSGLFLWQFSFWCFWKKSFYVTFSFIKNTYFLVSQLLKTVATTDKIIFHIYTGMIRISHWPLCCLGLIKL